MNRHGHVRWAYARFVGLIHHMLQVNRSASDAAHACGVTPAAASVWHGAVLVLDG